ncbi:hypothetical protein ACFFLM_21215 [Deinococcus oregonensis]|uniref:Uncharacterized protein n=1 Tax=Deinococcus oregonensis TaxID=1805970 RepID=A0ABV6B458_9DEIO
MSLVLLSNIQVPKDAKLGLVNLTIHAQDAKQRAILAKIATLERTWNAFRGLLESEISKSVGRPVKLLAGNYVRQSKGVVSYHGSVKMPGSSFIVGGRKSFNSATGVFSLWVIFK